MPAPKLPIKPDTSTLCFIDSFRAHKRDSLPYSAYIANAVAHFRGIRHRPWDWDQTAQCPRILFEPFASSIRIAALEGKAYKPMTKAQTDQLEKIFHRTIDKASPEEGTIASFAALRQAVSRGPNIVQPVAVLAAREKRASILEYCFGVGAVVDRNLARASTQRDSAGKGWNSEECEWTDPAMRKVLESRRKEIDRMTEGRKGSDGQWSDEQMEEWWGEFDW